MAPAAGIFLPLLAAAARPQPNVRLRANGTAVLGRPNQFQILSFATHRRGTSFDTAGHASEERAASGGESRAGAAEPSSSAAPTRRAQRGAASRLAAPRWAVRPSAPRFRGATPPGNPSHSPPPRRGSAPAPGARARAAEEGHAAPTVPADHGRATGHRATRQHRAPRRCCSRRSPARLPPPSQWFASLRDRQAVAV